MFSNSVALIHYFGILPDLGLDRIHTIFNCIMPVWVGAKPQYVSICLFTIIIIVVQFIIFHCFHEMLRTNFELSLLFFDDVSQELTHIFKIIMGNQRICVSHLKQLNNNICLFNYYTTIFFK